MRAIYRPRHAYVDAVETHDMLAVKALLLLNYHARSFTHVIGAARHAYMPREMMPPISRARRRVAKSEISSAAKHFGHSLFLPAYGRRGAMI